MTVPECARRTGVLWRILPALHGGKDDEHQRTSKVLSVWTLVSTRAAERLSSTVLLNGSVSSSQQAGQPAKVVSQEPQLLSRSR